MSANPGRLGAEEPSPPGMGKTPDSGPWPGNGQGQRPDPGSGPGPGQASFRGQEHPEVVAEGTTEKVYRASVNPFSPAYVRRIDGSSGEAVSGGSPDPGSLPGSLATAGAVPVALIQPSGNDGAGPAVSALPGAQPSPAAALAKEAAERQWWLDQQRHLRQRANLALALAAGALAGLAFVLYSGYHPGGPDTGRLGGGSLGDGQYFSRPGAVSPSLARPDASPLPWPGGKPDANTQSPPPPGSGPAEDGSRQSWEAEREMQFLRLDSRVAALEKAQGEMDQALAQMRFARLDAPLGLTSEVEQPGSSPAGQGSQPLGPSARPVELETRHPEALAASTGQLRPAATETRMAEPASTLPLPDPYPVDMTATAKGQRYGIQLATLSSTEAVPDLVKRNGLDPRNLYLFAIGQRSLLILGFFPSQDKARAFLEELPPGLKKAKPIVRSFPSDQLLQPYKQE